MTEERSFYSEKARSSTWDAVRGKLAMRHAQCLQAIRERGPSTAKDLESIVPTDLASIRPRLSELVTMGILAEIGTRYCKATRSHETVYDLSGRALPEMLGGVETYRSKRRKKTSGRIVEAKLLEVAESLLGSTIKVEGKIRGELRAGDMIRLT